MSSSTVLADSSDDKDDQLIIIVNADGTITVDPETLQKLIENKHQTSNLSVVRVGDGNATSDDTQDEEESSGPHINLTVEGFYSGADPEIQQLATDVLESNNEVVDPFSQMEPEHIARLESVLQSEQAKEILGTNLSENQDLNSMLDMLEGKDEVEVPAPRVVHNDHSYTSTIPAGFQQPVQSQSAQSQTITPVTQPQVTHRPLTRGGRRGRGRGLLTRGGTRGGGITQSPVVTPQVSAPTLILQSPAKIIQASPQKTYIVTQAPRRVVAQPVVTQSVITESGAGEVVNQPPATLVRVQSPGTPRLISQRKLVPKPQTPQLKQQTLPQVLTPQSSPASATLVSTQESGLNTPGIVKVITSPISHQNVQKKVVTSRGGRGRGGRGGRGGRRGVAQTSPSTITASVPVPATGDEVSAALEAMELSPSQDSPLHQVQASTPPKASVAEGGETVGAPSSSGGRKKVTQTMIIRKVSAGKSEIVASPGKASSKARQHEDDSMELHSSPTIAQAVPKIILKQTPALKQSDSSPSLRGGKESLTSPEDGSTKKKREKKTAQLPIVVEVPELFSTPDIIRRVSTEKMPEPHPDPPPIPMSHPEPKVQVQPTHPPRESESADVEMTPESLLDSIHAEVAAKDDSHLLAEALLLDDLTNDDSESMTYPSKEKCETTKVSSGEMGSSGLSSSIEVQKPLISSPLEPAANQRIRKLPPIELPTTRSASKKAAASTNQLAPQQQQPSLPTQSPVQIKVTEKEKKRITASAVTEKRHSQETKRIPEKKYTKEEFVSDFEDEIESDQESWNSEDDPDRLWCICKKPHNNRFMICCDGCEEWFHGKCVGVTKAMGQQMEQQDTEWSCPNCKAKKEALSTKEPSSKLPSGQQTISSLECITCKKPARSGSNYCSETCIKRHALNMIALLNSEVEGLQPSTRVIVYEKSSGHLISDDMAPTVSNLADWLAENPTFEVHKLSITNKAYKKKQDLSAQAVKKQLKTQQPVVKQVVLKQQQIGQHFVKQAPQQVGLKTQQQAKSTASNKLTEIKPQPSPSKELPKQLVKAQQNPQSIKSQQNPQQPIKIQQAPLQSVKPQPPQVKSPPPKPPDKERPPLKQTFLIHKVNQGGTKEVTYTTKQPSTPKQIQIIQAQPLPPPVQTPKTKSKEKKEEDEEYKPKKSAKVEKTQPESGKRQSIDGKKQTTEKILAKEDKKRDSSNSSKESVEKKKEEKKRERKSTEKSEDNTPSTPSSTEPIRTNVKRTIQELLNQRVKQDSSISITNEEVKELAVSIEEALFTCFKDTGTKYKAKYRSLVFNIKDPKNFTLYKKIVEKAISPDQLVRLSPEELASQELAQWREKEAKHQLDIIKKNELDLIQQAKTVVLKSRKGEEVIETTPRTNISEIESALNHTSDDWELENAVISDPHNEEEGKKIKKEHSSRHDRRKSTSKDDRKRERSRSRSRHKSRSSSRDREKRKKEKDYDKEKDKTISKTEETLKEIEEVISQHLPQSTILSQLTSTQGGDSDMSDREPSSTVEISTPPPPEQEKPPVWQGYLNMSEVTKLCTSAYEVSGSCEDLGEELPEQLECVGRIQPDSVWEYVSRMKKAGTKDIVVIRFYADGVEEKMNYLSLYSYLNSRNRMAVIGSICKTVKDFYVLPLASHSPIPQVLLPLDGPGFDDYRPHLLLGIIIRAKKVKKGVGAVSSTIVSSSNKSERSYTPPLPDSGFVDGNNELPDSGSTTPPLPQFKAFPSGLTPPLPEEDEPYSPGEPYSPEDSQTEAILVNPDIQRNLEEVNKLIDEKYKQIQNLSQAAQGSLDDETPYSPSSSMSPPQTGDSNLPFLNTNVIKLPPNLQDILASIKGTPHPPMERQPSTMDVKSDPIVQAYTSQGMYYEGEEDEERREEEVRPSRDPRQRPDPRPKSSLSQLSDTDLVRKAVEMEAEPSYYYPPPPPPVYATTPQYKYPPPPPLPPDKERKRKERRGPPPMPHQPPPPQRRPGKWVAGNRHHGGPPPHHRGGMRGSRFRGGFDRGGFRGSFRPPHRGGPPQHRFRGGSHRNVQSEWDEEIRKFEQRKARERKRKASRSPSPRRRPSHSPPRRRSRRASSNSS